MSFFEKVGLSRRRSADSAKERLQLVLIHDRSGLSPGKLEALKDEIIDAISRHIEIDTAGVEISLTKDRDHQRLVANIPLIPMNRRRR
ncbi:MAG: cell division topological specificity factor MinE [Anaerolineales bacterium]|nr:MAG: cell division topological specificity factor MinE [Anaerolineales bacterium]